MSTRHFCDRCDQQLIEPDENVNFITGQPTSASEDICWRCRLQEIVQLYNEKTKDMPSRRAAYISWFEATDTATLSVDLDQYLRDISWAKSASYTLGVKGDQDAEP